MEQEKILRLGDLVKRDQLKAFLQRERRELIKKYSDRLPEEQIEAFRRFLAEPSRTTNDTELDEFAKFDRFFLADTDIATEYSPYELASYAAGFLATEFSLDQFRSMIRPELIDRLLP